MPRVASARCGLEPELCETVARPYLTRGEGRLHVSMGRLSFKPSGRANRNDRGANLVEFAVLAPLLILLVLGIVEFGWKFGQFNDVRHGVREGARFAAVNAGDANAIRDHVCGSMDAISAGMSQIRVILTDASPDDIGQTATIRVEADVTSLTNAPVISTFLPTELTSDIDFRLEQESTLWGVPSPQTLICP